jgi:quercetin dioxygenase-like cupin family protein
MKPVVVHEDERDWEGWPPDEVAARGDVRWRTLISAGLTPSAELTLGLARVPAGGGLSLHRHAQAEVYLVLAGTGVVSIDGTEHALRPGTSVFIPGGAEHGVRAAGEGELRFAYAFAAGSFDEIEYVF